MKQNLFHITERCYVYSYGFISQLWLEAGDMVLITDEISTNPRGWYVAITRFGLINLYEGDLELLQ